MKPLVFLLMSFIFAGCVEKLEENLPSLSDTQNPTPELIIYPGVFKAVSQTGPGTRAISDTRIEVYFPPALGGSGKFIYEVFVGSNEKFSYTSEVLEKNKVGGYYVVTISDREIFSVNTIRVEVKDAVKFAQSDSQNSIMVTTFSNEVCQFDGIVSASNLSGAEGKDSLRIKWVPALWTGASTPSTPIFYEITLLENGIERDRLHDPTLSESQGRVVRTVPFQDGKNESIVRGLKMNTRYTITVRCIHLGSVKNDFLPELYSEQNTKFVTLTTLDGNLSTLDFSEDELTLSLLNGVSGFFGFDASWGLVQGAFDHFRVYVKKKSAQWGEITSDCFTNYTDEESVICQKVSYDKLSTSITGLVPNTDYEARFVICAENSCSETSSQGESGRLIVDFPESIRTTPVLADFEGIKTIALNTSLSEIGSVELGFFKPDTTTGYAEEYLVTVRRGDSGPYVPLADEALTLDPYNIESATHLTVRGLQFGQVSNYCFRIQVKLGNEFDANTSQKCVNVSGLQSYKVRGDNLETNLNFLPPVSSSDPKEFSGLLNASVLSPSPDTDNSELVRLIWKRPIAGFYLTYDVYASEGNLPENDLFTQSNKSISLDAAYMDSEVRDPNTGHIFTELILPKGQNFTLGLATGFPGLHLEQNSCVWYCCPKLSPNDNSKTCEGTSELTNPNFKCFSACSDQISLQ